LFFRFLKRPANVTLHGRNRAACQKISYPTDNTGYLL